MDTFICSSVIFRFYFSEFPVCVFSAFFFRCLVHCHSISKSSLYVKDISSWWYMLQIFSPSLLYFDFAYDFFWSWEFIVLYLCGQIYVFIGVIIRKPFFTPWLKRNPPIFSFGTCIILFFTFILMFYLEFTLVCGVRYRSTLSFPKIPRLHSLSIIY